MSLNGPFVLEVVTVERGGQSRRHEIKMTTLAGQTHEVRVNVDVTVEVVPAQK